MEGIRMELRQPKNTIVSCQAKDSAVGKEECHPGVLSRIAEMEDSLAQIREQLSQHGGAVANCQAKIDMFEKSPEMASVPPMTVTRESKGKTGEPQRIGHRSDTLSSNFEDFVAEFVRDSAEQVKSEVSSWLSPLITRMNGFETQIRGELHENRTRHLQDFDGLRADANRQFKELKIAIEDLKLLPLPSIEDLEPDMALEISTCTGQSATSLSSPGRISTLSDVTAPGETGRCGLVDWARTPQSRSRASSLDEIQSFILESDTPSAGGEICCSDASCGLSRVVSLDSLDLDATETGCSKGMLPFIPVIVAHTLPGKLDSHIPTATVVSSWATEQQERAAIPARNVPIKILS
eukprot:gnl/TRDRNA2_/TRDRNA2_148589_c1_seq1.p1 gnl/TRDRNA2_/TRDRNA2_148589_c1~~gnl/TRDRNA2_/TRDRNA2_148589_c1_seq1.p1  ORF type:complete len:351 (+),score=55.49 gnl/TRDRNA2_/TRDRNA2_148589_c1_seq1:92-1144(+)